MTLMLRSGGCASAPLTNWDATDFTFTTTEIGNLDAKRKTSPNLLRWEELPADVAELHRAFGLSIRRLSQLRSADSALPTFVNSGTARSMSSSVTRPAGPETEMDRRDDVSGMATATQRTPVSCSPSSMA